MKLNNVLLENLTLGELLAQSKMKRPKVWHEFDGGDGDFTCENLGITSLVGGPKYVERHFYCSKNMLTDLVGAPIDVGGDFICNHMPSLTSLKTAQPIKIEAGAWFYRCGFTSLKGIHKYISYIGGVASFEANPIKSHMLGLLKIEGLEEIKFDVEVHGGESTKGNSVTAIINRHLENGRNIFDCQAELEDNGYEEYAQL